MFGAAAARARSEVFNELASLTKAGISIGHALGDLGEDMSGKQLGRTLVRMGRQVSNGDPLATAMRDQGDAFIPLTIAMIEVGEEGGRLEEALRSVAEYHERDFELRHLLTRELAYPMVLLAALILIPAIAQFVIVWLTRVRADPGADHAADYRRTGRTRGVSYPQPQQDQDRQAATRRDQVAHPGSGWRHQARDQVAHPGSGWRHQARGDGATAAGAGVALFGRSAHGHIAATGGAGMRECGCRSRTRTLRRQAGRGRATVRGACGLPARAERRLRTPRTCRKRSCA